MARLPRPLFALAAVLAITSAGVLVTAQQRPSRANPEEIAQLLTQVETSTDQFRRSVDQSRERIWMDGNGEGRAIDDLVSDLIRSTHLLREGFARGEDIRRHVGEVVRRAASINTFMDRYLPPVQVEQDWLMLRRDLDTLARRCGVPRNWKTLRFA